MYSIDTISLDKLNDIRAQIGGKAAGFVLLSSQPEIETPPDVAVITTRAYEEHLQSFAEVIALFLKDKEFQASPLLRFLVLEGKKRFIAQHPTKKSLMRRFLRRHRGDALQALIEGGGLTRAIRKKPIAPKTLQAITAALEAQFAALSPAQGLRFRSSSTVEDIEGFNGAGLYLSSSGFLHPGAQTPKKDKKKSVERAIKEVWASYWSFEATEERQQEAIDHLSGAMAIVVHPRFEDEAERANGVLTFSLLPDGQRVMRLNVQAGSQSVTNPDSRELPEQDEVTQQDTATPIIQRSRSSTLSAQHLLSDAQLLALFSQTRALTEAALSKSNQGLSAAQRQRTMTLDVEFRVVQEGWPKLASAEVKPSRIIIKQARSLEPEARGLPPWLYQEEIPRDLLARARKLEEFTCTDQDLTLRVLSLNTSPSLAPDFGYAQTPFTAWLKLSLNGKEVTLYQRDFTKLERPILRGAGTWSLRAVTNEAAAKESKLAQLNVDLEKYSLWTDTNEQRQGSLQCEVKTLFITPTSYLLDLLQSAPKE